jgi:hypothetical protein
MVGSRLMRATEVAAEGGAESREDCSNDRVDHDHEGGEAAEGDLRVGSGDGMGEEKGDAVDDAHDQAAECCRAGIGVLEAGEDRADRGEQGEDPVDRRRDAEQHPDDRAEDERDDDREEDLDLAAAVAERNRLWHGRPPMT